MLVARQRQRNLAWAHHRARKGRRKLLVARHKGRRTLLAARQRQRNLVWAHQQAPKGRRKLPAARQQEGKLASNVVRLFCKVRRRL